MSLATRCPACATRFRVVADQLKISDGWVRCGQCGEVFDATQDLRSDDGLMAAPVADIEPPPPVRAPAAPLVSDPPWPGLAEATPEPPATEGPEVNEPEPEPEPPPLDFPPDAEPVLQPPSATPDLQEGPHWTEDEAETVVDPGPEPASAPELPGPVPADTDAGAWLAAPAAEPEEASAADLAEVPMLPEPPGFVRQAQRRAFWQRRAVRVGLGLLSLLLLLGLALQWVLHERHRIAALRPDFKPLLETLCQPLGCRIEPMRWIDALNIDSTTFARRGSGRYGLEVVVRNASAFELALPALELSLTDTREQLLLRRVILPAELGVPSGLVPAQGQLTLRLDIAVEAPQADALAGYRTLLFYP